MVATMLLNESQTDVREAAQQNRKIIKALIRRHLKPETYPNVAGLCASSIEIVEQKVFEILDNATEAISVQGALLQLESKLSEVN